eukprot:TRINITY_DN3233_c0_g1_i1.p1 TRINITY_DN3233_c0_g1~~TRINITY_DN3233_c0_g1_i1.p1  ORF type:complete len:164 (+),score=18.50 TRINITY_DN3233_c0_g1_i1:104-595(+)
MPTGRIMRWKDDKGFGFIQCDDGSEDVFCHVSALADGEGSVRDGDKVRFKIEYDERKGKERAARCERIRDSSRSRSRSRGRRRSRSRSRRRSPPPRRFESRPGDWTCPNCDFLNFARNDKCLKCGTSKDGGGGRDDSRDRGRGGGGRDRSRRRDRSRSRSGSR